jgi:hypothetical protein
MVLLIDGCLSTNTVMMCVLKSLLTLLLVCVWCVLLQPGKLNVAAIETDTLADAVQLARRLQCRSEQATWATEVAEALLDLRLCVKALDYKNMLRLTHALRATDKSNVTVRFALLPLWCWVVVVVIVVVLLVVGVECLDYWGRMLLQAFSGSRRGIGGKKRRTSVIDVIPGVGVSSSSGSASAAVAATERPEFCLNEATIRELNLVQDHYDNHTMIQEMTQALHTVGPSGPVGSLSVVGVNADDMTLLVHKVERTRPKTAEAAQLLECLKTVRGVRAALLEDNWDGVGLTLARVLSADAALGSGGDDVKFGMSVHPLGRGELQRVKEEADYRQVVNELAAAVSSGRLQGEAGRLDVSAAAPPPPPHVQLLVVSLSMTFC